MDHHDTEDIPRVTGQPGWVSENHARMERQECVDESIARS